MIKYTALALALASTSAMANLDSIPDVENGAKKGFHGSVGIAVASMPEYVGGDDAETTALPLINVSYNDTFYFKYNRLGAWAYKGDNGFRVGGVITQHKGWESSDGDLLENYKDRDASTMAGVNVAYAKGMFNSEAGYVVDVSDESDGAKFYAQATYTMLATPKYTLSIVAKVEALDDDLTEYYYSGFNEDNSIYVADAATNVTLGLIGTYNINKKWKVIAAVTATSLDDEIADSPLVEEDTHNIALIGASYSF